MTDVLGSLLGAALLMGSGALLVLIALIDRPEAVLIYGIPAALLAGAGFWLI